MNVYGIKSERIWEHAALIGERLWEQSINPRKALINSEKMRHKLSKVYVYGVVR